MLVFEIGIHNQQSHFFEERLFNNSPKVTQLFAGFSKLRLLSPQYCPFHGLIRAHNGNFVLYLREAEPGEINLGM